MFPGMMGTAIVLDLAIEGTKIAAVGFLAGHWRSVSLLWLLVLMMFVIGAAAINAMGVYSQLVAAHISDRALATADTAAIAERKQSELAIMIQAQQGMVADVDRRIALMDGAVERATAAGKTKTAMQIAEDNRKTRAALTEERRQAMNALATLQAQQARRPPRGTTSPPRALLRPLRSSTRLSCSASTRRTASA
jgi:hypothetical protein